MYFSSRVSVGGGEATKMAEAQALEVNIKYVIKYILQFTIIFDTSVDTVCPVLRNNIITIFAIQVFSGLFCVTVNLCQEGCITSQLPGYPPARSILEKPHKYKVK